MGLLDWWASRRAPSYEQSMLVYIASSTDERELFAYSQDRSGWQREAAMRRAIELRIPRLLPLLANLLNDHVYAIGERARTQMLEQAVSAPLTQLIDVLPDVQRLRAAGRHDHSGWLQRFETVLCERLGCDALKACTITAPVRVARACFDVLRRHGGVDQALVEQLLGSSADLLVLRSALLDVPAPSEEALVRRWQLAARSKLGPIRALGAARFLAGGPAASPDPERQAYAVAALLDNQAAVRAAAAAWLTARQFDVIGHYRAVLLERGARVKHQVAALLGLEAARATSELPLIRRLDFASPRVRRVALKTWIKLAETEKDDVALAALRDPAPAVRRFAYTAVHFHGAYLPDEMVFATLQPEADREAYRAFARRDRWQWLIYLADLATRTPPYSPAWTEIRHELQRWAFDPHNYGLPSPDQARRLTDPELRAQLNRLTAGTEWWQPNIREVLARLP